MATSIPPDADAWAFIREEIPHAWVEIKNIFMEQRPGFMELAEKRYRAGQEEYRGTSGEWINKPEDWFTKEIYEEIVDCVIYAAMRRVLHPDDI